MIDPKVIVARCQGFYNFGMKDKTLSINWGELWDFTAKTKADFALRSAAYSPRGAVNSDKVSFGAVIIHFARTYFERN